MLFGDRNDFAIEAGLEPDLQPPSQVWGHMCVWCRGISLGDITERHCGFSSAYSGFVWLASNLDRLWAVEFEALDDVALWNFLDGILYGYHGLVELQDDRTVEECQRDSNMWHHYDFLTNWDEQFDGYKAFIVCPPGGEICILSRDSSEKMCRAIVSRDGFLAAVDGFKRWYDGEELRLQSARLN